MGHINISESKLPKKTYRELQLLRHISDMRQIVTLFNPGSVPSYPIIYFETGGGNFEIACNDVSLKIPSMLNGSVTIDCEKGFVVQNSRQLRTTGEWPEILPGKNTISVTGNYSDAEILLRSAWT